MASLIIKYCERCGERIPSTDFEEGKAVVFENRSYCKSCSSAIFPKDAVSLSPLQEEISSSVPSPHETAHHTPLRKSPPRGLSSYSSPRRRRGVSQSSQKKDRLLFIVSGVILILLVISGLILFVASEKESITSSSKPNIDMYYPSSSNKSKPEIKEREEKATAKIQRAIEFESRFSEKYSETIRYWKDALESAEGTKKYQEAQQGFNNAQKRMEIKASSVFYKTKEIANQLCSEGKFDAARLQWQEIPPEIITRKLQEDIIEQQRLIAKQEVEWNSLSNPGTGIDPRSKDPKLWETLFDEGTLNDLVMEGSSIKIRKKVIYVEENSTNSLILSTKKYENYLLFMDLFISKGGIKFFPKYYVNNPKDNVVLSINAQESGILEEQWITIQVLVREKDFFVTLPQKGSKGYIAQHFQNAIPNPGPSQFLISIPPGNQVYFSRILIKTSTWNLEKEKKYNLEGIGWNSSKGWKLEEGEIIGDNTKFDGKNILLRSFGDKEWEDYEFQFQVKDVQGDFWIYVRISDIAAQKYVKFRIAPELLSKDSWTLVNIKVKGEELVININEKNFAPRPIPKEFSRGLLAFGVGPGAKVRMKEVEFILYR